MNTSLFFSCMILTLGGVALFVGCNKDNDNVIASVTDHEMATPDSGPDIGLFFDGALIGDVTTQDCTLSDGARTTCYRITVVGLPVDYEVGPFCPPTIFSSSADGGIWFDGVGLYELDGAFITSLPSLYNDSNWMLYDETGNVNVTDTREAFEGAARPNVAPEYRNHCVEGRLAWLSGGQPVATTFLIPTNPVAADAPLFDERVLGVTLNGVRIDGAAPVNAILGAYTIAAFDDCGGHFNPVSGYHMHASMGCSGIEVEGHGEHFGYALDGYPIYTALAEESGSDLDQCGGHFTDEIGYHYHASPAAANSVVRCLTGKIVRGQ